MTAFILDTDLWYDPDDLFAALYLLNSRVVPDLVVTGDEVRNKRAQQTKYWLEQLGYPEIKVIAGTELPGKTRLFCQDLPDKTYDVSGDLVEEIAKIVDANDVTLYLGCTAMSNLARFQQTHPELSNKIKLYQMGGSLLNAEKGEHNIRIDITAAQQVLGSDIETYLVMLDTTLNPTFEISNKHLLYTLCKQNANPGLQAIAQNIDEFNQAINFWTFMHDPLTISAALGHNFVDFYEASVAVDEQGVIKLDERGNNVYLSKPESRAVAFMDHFDKKIRG